MVHNISGGFNYAISIDFIIDVSTVYTTTITPVIKTDG